MPIIAIKGHRIHFKWDHKQKATGTCSNRLCFGCDFFAFDSTNEIIGFLLWSHIYIHSHRVKKFSRNRNRSESEKQNKKIHRKPWSPQFRRNCSIHFSRVAVSHVCFVPHSTAPNIIVNFSKIQMSECNIQY